MEAPSAPPAKTKSIARSLLKSVVTRPAPVAGMPSAVSTETSVKVLLPLLRHKVLCGKPAPSVAEAIYTSKSKKHAPVAGPETEEAAPEVLLGLCKRVSKFCAVKCTGIAGGTASEEL